MRARVLRNAVGAPASISRFHKQLLLGLGVILGVRWYYTPTSPFSALHVLVVTSELGSEAAEPQRGPHSCRSASSCDFPKADRTFPPENDKVGLRCGWSAPGPTLPAGANSFSCPLQILRGLCSKEPNGHTAIDDHGATGHKAGSIRQHEQCRLRDLFRARHPLDGV